MRNYDGKDFYFAGKEIKAVLSESEDGDDNNGKLQALIRDFIPRHEELLETLLTISASNGFTNLLNVEDRQIAEEEKVRFVDNLKRVYDLETVIAAECLVCDLLSLSYPDKNYKPGRYCEASDLSATASGCASSQDAILSNAEEDSRNAGITRPIQAALSSQYKGILFASVALGAVVFAATWHTLESAHNAPYLLQSSGNENGTGCTISDQAELKSIVTELNSLIGLADPRRMTGGTWQSVLSAYDMGTANLGESYILDNYITRARKAKALEAIGCTYP